MASLQVHSSTLPSGPTVDSSISTVSTFPSDDVVSAVT